MPYCHLNACAKSDDDRLYVLNKEGVPAGSGIYDILAAETYMCSPRTSPTSFAAQILITSTE